MVTLDIPYLEVGEGYDFSVITQLANPSQRSIFVREKHPHVADDDRLIGGDPQSCGGTGAACNDYAEAAAKPKIMVAAAKTPY
ncbi:hypothetical protein EVAR_62934_1 [Eumeta japonica]|uniref:Uncharacterized protein n=1 Tax=Eumeta variegata TaxID=151549 RepID=A0A4C2ADU7_EUMVA|nr:hypothetical protein EVAR_62934_1 [Eumeta japonica]